ncbi:hypothetical protein CPB86DRAFT_777797 [Serendipita vermifera]|nr:hypothetical protein CPB86DRAFT_777797 [Serendipita vermifera]
MFIPRLGAFLALTGLAAAHYQLTYPPSRGFDHDIQTQGPCGGFNEVSTRTPFPLGDSYITLHSGHPINLIVMISFAENPTDIRNFTTSANGTAQAPLRNWFRAEQTEPCISLNILGSGYNVTDGTNATIVTQSSGDGALYQCADVVLSSNVTIPSNITCTSPITTTGTPTGTATETHSATATQGAAEHRFVANIGASLLSVSGLALLFL